jgi:membrane protease YdiL (CAAX protease family)
MGFILCYFIYYTKSLWAPVLAHFVINSIGSMMAAIAFAVDMESLEALSDATTAEVAEGIGFYIGFGIFALVFAGIFIAIYIKFKRHNLARNEEEGIITDTHAAYVAETAAAAEAGEWAEQPPKVLTWGFWATCGLGLALMIITQVTMSML